MSERLDQQFSFLREIDREKCIGRQTYLADGSRKENDAEHAWHMAVMTLLLSEYANEEIDVLRTISMLLIHDLVEIDAGDTYAYDEAGKETQRERECQAADRIFGLLPKNQGVKMRQLWEEFEARQTPEAKFARTMDCIQPMMLNAASGGRSWVEHGVKQSQILKRNKNTAEGAEKLWDYSLHKFIVPNVANGKIKRDYAIKKIQEFPELKNDAAAWFHEKWKVPLEAYMESMEACIQNKMSVPQWYIVMDGQKIIAGLGVIENDFHNRKDLTPNICSVYVEEPYRNQKIAGEMLQYVCNECSRKGIDTLYLLTDHTTFYERYDWKFLCMVQGDGESELSRMYKHEMCGSVNER